GIRDFHVTGVQTCALPILAGPRRADGRYVAAVTEHHCMQEWMQLVEAAGWRADAMLPQASLHQDQTPERGLRIQPSPWPNGPSTDRKSVVEGKGVGRGDRG